MCPKVMEDTTVSLDCDSSPLSPLYPSFSFSLSPRPSMHTFFHWSSWIPQTQQNKLPKYFSINLPWSCAPCIPHLANDLCVSPKYQAPKIYLDHHPLSIYYSNHPPKSACFPLIYLFTFTSKTHWLNQFRVLLRIPSFLSLLAFTLSLPQNHSTNFSEINSIPISSAKPPFTAVYLSTQY